MDLGLKGKAVIVAAASEGIARAAAERLAAEGARLAICARRRDKLDAAAAELRSRHNADVISKVVDVTDGMAVREFCAHVAGSFGAIDVCVTNAGGPPAKDFLATTDADWRAALDANFLSIVHFAHAVLPVMQRQRWGRLITITSVAVKQPVPDLILSNSVRAGVVGLVKSLANEFGKDGITINNVGPGYTETARLQSLLATRANNAGVTPDTIRERLAADVPLRRLGQPQEVADAIVWLASENAAYITGQTILVDGGIYRGL